MDGPSSRSRRAPSGTTRRRRTPARQQHGHANSPIMMIEGGEEEEEGNNHGGWEQPRNRQSARAPGGIGSASSHNYFGDVDHEEDGGDYYDEDGSSSAGGFLLDDSYSPGDDDEDEGGTNSNNDDDRLLFNGRQLRSSPVVLLQPQGSADAADDAYLIQEEREANRQLVRNIASFMTLSDAGGGATSASLRSLAVPSSSSSSSQSLSPSSSSSDSSSEMVPPNEGSSLPTRTRRPHRHRRNRRSRRGMAGSNSAGDGSGAGIDRLAGGSDRVDYDRHRRSIDDDDDDDDDRSDDSWVVGVGMPGAEDASWWSGLETPSTPGLVAISPLRTSASFQRLGDREDCDGADEEEEEESRSMESLLRERRRRWAQEKLASAVFSHPLPLRGFCVDAYQAAQDIRVEQQQRALMEKARREPDPETSVEPSTTRQPMVRRSSKRRSKERARLLWIVHQLIDCIFHNVPLSVLLDVVDSLGSISVDTSVASFRITLSVVNGSISALVYTSRVCWDAVTNFNPFLLLEALISLQFNAMGKTSEVLVSGIQSVTTGVESASSIALHRLSAANLSLSNCAGSAASVGATLMRGAGVTGVSGRDDRANRKLLRKMSSINDAARVVSYREHPDDTGGLTRQAISRTRRMMHYSVSLRPFVATVAVKPSQQQQQQQKQNDGIGRADFQTNVRKASLVPRFDDATLSSDVMRPNARPESSDRKEGVSRRTEVAALVLQRDGSDSSANLVDASFRSTGSPSVGNDSESPLICSPQSFPPTPRSRQLVLARGSQFADDVVFLARDRLRIHDGLESHNERTREMAWALKEGKRLAIFDANYVNGIELTCGQHIATKVGNMHYASTRSMVPILRNCYVYFEVTVMPRLNLDLQVQNAPVTLSIGLSTLEMPPNTLLGSWQGSVGICTTGQILVSGQWCSPEDPSVGAYGYGATVGCLVFLDDSSSFETWDGVMVNASVTFSINGVVVPTPLPTLAHNSNGAMAGSVSGASSSSSSATQQQTSPSRVQRSAVVSPTPDSWSSSKPSSNHTSLNPTLLVPASEELYPTVTLQTPSTAVMCRFSSEDVILQDSIGPLPRGTTVYAVDGSVIRTSPDMSNDTDNSRLLK